MARFKVNWERHVVGHLGAFHLRAGDVVELTGEQSDFIQRDSDGILTRVADGTPLIQVDESEPVADALIEGELAEDDHRAVTSVPHDRMQQRGRARRQQDRHGDRNSDSTGPMTAADLGAHKGE